jgi:hypothetical protein
MRFSPNFVEALLIKPLKYFFASYAHPELTFSEDEKLSKIDISSITDFNKEATQLKPRILVDRGGFRVDGVGISDNMAERVSPFTTRGLTDQKNMVLINGLARIIIEARNRGTCELVTDMVTHFYVWSKPFLCDSQGIKNFGLPMSVSECTQGKEDTEIFQVVISFPYVMEEIWNVSDDALKLKELYLNITAAD